MKSNNLQYIFTLSSRCNVYIFYFQGNLAGAVSLSLPLHLFYKNSHVSSERVWAYVEDELFIPMRPGLKGEIGDCVCII